MTLLTGVPYRDPLQVEGDLDRNISMQNGLNLFLDNLTPTDRAFLERVAMTVVEVTSGVPPHAWAGHRHHEMHFSGSLMKVVALYTAMDLVANARQLIADYRPRTPDVFFALLHSQMDGAITNATPARIKTTPGIITNVHVLPNYTAVIRPIVNASTGRPTDATFEPAYLNSVQEMIVHSDDEHAMKCIHGLGYGLLAARAADDGFLEPATPTGVWLAGDYQQTWPAVRVPVVNDGTSAQATTTIAMARLYTLMADGLLINLESSATMRDLLRQAGAWSSWFHFTTPPVWPRSAVDVTASKIGVGSLGSVAVPGEPVYSEGMTAIRSTNGRQFVVVWQNMKGTSSFTNLERVARMAEAAITAFVP